MGTFFLFILVVFFVIIILGLSFLRGLVRLFIGHPSTENQQNAKNKNNEYQNNNNRSDQSNNHKKIFTKDEGEYIDYEEIKI